MVLQVLSRGRWPPSELALSTVSACTQLHVFGLCYRGRIAREHEMLHECPNAGVALHGIMEGTLCCAVLYSVHTWTNGCPEMW